MAWGLLFFKLAEALICEVVKRLSGSDAKEMCLGCLRKKTRLIQNSLFIRKSIRIPTKIVNLFWITSVLFVYSVAV